MPPYDERDHRSKDYSSAKLIHVQLLVASLADADSCSAVTDGRSTILLFGGHPDWGGAPGQRCLEASSEFLPLNTRRIPSVAGVMISVTVGTNSLSPIQ